MKLRFIMLVSVLLFVSMASAGELRSPVCPASFGSAPCIINVTNSPIMSDYERVYIDTSNGYYLTGSNFYYAGMNYQNSQIDLFSKRYNITSINTGEAILTSELYKNDDSLQIVIGKELILKNGYTLELVDVGEDGAVFSLKRNNEILETGAVNRNNIFSYNITIDGKEVEIFRTTLTGIFGSNNAVIIGTCLRDTKIIRDGDSYGDYEINLKDVDGDGDIDIVYSLKNKTIDLPDEGVTPVLDGFLTLRTYPVYVPFYESLERFNLTGEDSNFRIYSINNNLEMSVSSFLSSPPDGSVIAAGLPAGINTNPAVAYKDSNSIINELRGDHTFYIYTKGNLSLSVTKQDLNWYSGSDALDVKIYSSTNKLMKNITIPDDGNLGNNGHRGNWQTGTLEAILDEGVYKVTMTGGGDLLIRSIKLNNGNIIVQNPFLAGALYTSDTKFNLYTMAVKGDRLKFLTYHTTGLQVVNITSDSYSQSLKISAVNTPFYIDLPPSDELYKIEVPKGDVIITANSYFSFSSDSYFSTSSAKILPLQNSMDWLNKNKVDYVIIPSSNPFTGLYFFKPKTDKEYYVRSPKSPWTDYTIDTWSAPNIFYFNPDEDNTWEYLTMNNSGTTNLNKERLKYVAIQTQGNIGYRGEFYKVMDGTLPEMALSKKVSDIDNKTLLLNKEWQVGGTYTLALKDVDSEGKYAVLELSRLNKPVSRQIISKGSTMFYNISFKGKDVTIFQGKLTDVFHGANTSMVRLSDIELYDENMTVIKSGASVGNETLSLSDINNDGLPDIVVTRNSDIKIEKSTRKTLFDSYLDLVVDDGGTFYLERKVISPSTVTNSSNIARESSYTLAPYFPGNNMTLTFPDFDITAIDLDASGSIDQVKASLKELKNKPDDVIVIPDGSVYKYFSISIDEENIKNATVYFRVNRSWINYNNISNASVALLEFHDGSWDVLPTYITGSDEKFAYYSAKADDISALFAISGGISLDQALASQAQSDIISHAESAPDAKQVSLLEEYKNPDITATAQVENSEKPNKSDLYLILLAVSSISIVTSGYFITRRSNVLNSKTISYLSRLCSEIFNSLLLTFLLLLLIDNIWDNSVTKNLNLNYLMIIVFIFGIISLYGNRTETGEATVATKKEYITTAGIGILGMIIIWSKINYMGFISYPISIISGILIVLLSFLMLEDNDVLN